ncbi:phosphoribosylamine--glycine ligase [Aureimonas mangrovi]|uniref:phosphoribosylamine--glycine ligase n=1 Tax=Aureimonas mangrovi TaxID=2758041 RepID=UPI00163DB76C|nr:phosphoribosylamine--glycine ligase [Aureimonas mangrovi]
MTNVLLIGAGGREHALAWKLKRSPSIGRLFAAPGNPGIAEEAEIAALDIADGAAVVAFCRQNAVDFVVVGPEKPLVDGLVDELLAAGIAAFGPSAAAARLEGSKAFTKALCDVKSIPTARYARFDDLAAARAYVERQGAPIVVKADGLAAGKGVTVAASVDEALAALEDCLAEPGSSVVVEECLEGPEASLFCLCDGRTAIAFGTAEDHKRAFDGDKGPNTGGMGAYSPSGLMDEALVERAMAEIVRPTLEGMAEAGTPFKGVLYAGLMLTVEGPKLIEYNVRFGDPECQVLMMRLEDDILPILMATASGGLADVSPRWRDEAAVTVVMASPGYPGAHRRGTVIAALPPESDTVKVFHAGTTLEGDVLTATGGRVLNVSAIGTDVGKAADAAYEAVAQVDWPEAMWRTDIAHRAR